ncbi:eukaryotic translation initiation factor 3 subunit A, partial [Cladochytrium tenue]
GAVSQAAVAAAAAAAAPPQHLEPLREVVLIRVDTACHELIAVSQQTAALELLHDIMMSKRSRSTPLTTLEPVMLKFIELTVVLKKGKVAKEGLHQYKNISQNITVTSIEAVMKKFIELSEKKVEEAQKKANQINMDSVEDLEATETPESIILSTVSGDVSKDRTDREVVTPWLKFLWEAYRTALDILRNNARLEILYQSIAGQAFKFCLKYARKTEFRRLCELLRQHLSTAAKYSHQTHAINLNDPETLQRHLDTRFDQLNAAAELELWQEAFRSIEDIHNLLAITKKPAKPFMMANYFEKLARIFLVGENYLFHAAAWSKYYGTVRLNKNLPEEEHQRMASIVLVSALSIPIISTSKTGGLQTDADDGKPKTTRLANLLRVAKTPTREALLKEALNKNVFSRVPAELRELHNILEVQFHPLSICKRIAPIMASLSSQPTLNRYTRPLHQVVLTRLVQQLSQVYETITIDSLVSLASFPASVDVGVTHDAESIEKFIMDGCRKGELSIRVNHMSKTLTFVTDVFSGVKGTISEGPKLQSLPSEQMRLHLTRLARKLYTAMDLINPARAEMRQTKQAEAVKEAIAAAEEERRSTLERRLLIEKKKELRENELAKKARDEEQKRKLRQQQELEAERIRTEEEVKKRESERFRQMEEDRERKLAADLAKSLRSVVKDPEDLEAMSKKDLEAKKLEILEQERNELQRKIKLVGRRVDHTERALRKEELPLLSSDYDRQKVVDRELYDALAAKVQKEAEANHTANVQTKTRLQRMRPDYQAYKKAIEAKVDQDYENKLKRSEKLIADAKAARIKEIHRLREERDERLKREEEERIRHEEEERLQQEAYEREQAERVAKAEERRKEETDRKK